MASKGKCRFLAGGEKRVCHDARKRIVREISAKYAKELAEAGFFRRWCLKWHIRHEAQAELKRIKPSRKTLYGMTKLHSRRHV